MISCNADHRAASAVRPESVPRCSRSANGASSPVRWRGLGLLCLAIFATGCSELKARHHAREGNTRFLEGDYAGAVREYEISEQTYPGLAVVALNKGLACRQMMTPGGKSADQASAVDCATSAFQKMKELSPGDKRGDQLYIQTLFDGDRFDTLAQIYEKQLQADPKNTAAVNGLISVHSRADHWNEALKYTIIRADLDQTDAEEQYAVGVMIFNRLYQKGGADQEKAKFDPRPDPNAPPPPPPKRKRRGRHAKAEPPPVPTKVPPPFTVGDAVGAERVRLADIGIKYLQRALEIRPNYKEAMGFISLVYRQKSFAYLEKPTEWEPLFNLANEWLAKANQAAGAPTATAGDTVATPAAAPASDDKAKPGDDAKAKAKQAKSN